MNPVKQSGVVSAPNGRPMAWDVTLPPASSTPLIVFAHGFKGFKDWGAWHRMAEALAQQGIGVLKFNFSLNGTTPDHPTDFVDLEAFGRNTISQEVNDFVRILQGVMHNEWDWTRQVNLRRIWIMGHSRGGGVTMVVLGEMPSVRGAIGLAPISRFDRWDEETLRRWEKEGVIYVENARTGQQMPLYFELAEDIKAHRRGRFNLRERLASEHRPILLLHGKADPTVPYAESIELFEWAANAELCLHPTADHAFGTRHPWEAPALPAPMEWVVRHIAAFVHNPPTAE